ncbi:Uncharacterised protein [Paenibacillus thiaminolyticus]|nr:Uncharacterised protein [Paenibacillus thiaminolyticus]
MIIEVEVVDDYVDRFLPVDPVHKKINLLPEVYQSIDRCT